MPTLTRWNSLGVSFGAFFWFDLSWTIIYRIVNRNSKLETMERKYEHLWPSVSTYFTWTPKSGDSSREEFRFTIRNQRINANISREI